MDLKRDYFEDIKLIKSNFEGFWVFVLLVLLFTFPFLVKGYYIYVANLLLINVIIAIGLNIVVGYTGQVSLGHAGFMAIGAFTSVILMKDLGVPFILSVPLAALFSALIGFLVGIPALRLEGPYLAIATLGFGMAIEQILGLLPWTGGRMGLETPPMTFLEPINTVIPLGFVNMTVEQQNFYVILFFTVILTLFAVNLVKSRIGRAFIAVRDSDIAANAMGVNLTYYKTLAFAISAFYVGIAGALQAHMLSHITTVQYGLIQSIYMLAMIVVGGLASILGSILGASIFTLLPQLLAKYGYLNSIITGAIVIIIICFEPLGLRGRWIKIKIYWKMWPF